MKYKELLSIYPEHLKKILKKYGVPNAKPPEEKEVYIEGVKLG